MAVIGMVVALVIAALGALLVGSAAAALTSGGGLGLAAALAAILLLCVVVPVLLERRLTRAFRKLQPGAKGMFFQTLAVVNAVWLAALILLTPRYVRSALEQRGVTLIPGHSEAVAAWLRRAAAFIPRSSEAEPAPAAPAPSTEAARPLASTSALSAPTTVPSVSAAPTPVPIREAPLSSDDTPAAKVYRERAATVVVLHTRSPVPSSGPLAAIYGRLGISFSEGLGSGFFVESSGLVVTNHHVIDGASTLQLVTKEGATFNDVSVLADDAQNDLALLSVPGKDLPAAPLAGPKPVAVGARAIAIGCPLGFEYTLTEGIVSAHRNIEGTRFLQMQTGIAPGSSGGPLFDQNGSVIGVNTATSGGSMNLAVDAAEVTKLLAAPRTPRALERFVQGPRLGSLETEGGELDPTTRMNLREAAGLLANIALKCAKPLPDDAQVTLTLPKQLSSEAQTESNLTHEAEACMSMSLRLLAMQLSLVFSQAAKPPASINFTIADLPREDGSKGTLVYHFKR